MAWSKVSSKTKNGKKREPFSELVVRTVSKRIDLTQFEGIGKWEVEKRLDGGYAIKTGRDNFSLEEAETIVKLPDLIVELKDLRWKHMQVLRERKDLRDEGLRMTKKLDSERNRIESLLDALRIIRDDLDETTGLSVELKKIRNFANDATQ